MFNNIRFKKARERSGQSTVEYIILVTAVIGVIILFMTGKDNSFQGKLNETLNVTAEQIKSKAQALDESHDVNGTDNSTSKITVDPTSNKVFPR